MDISITYNTPVHPLRYKPHATTEQAGNKNKIKLWYVGVTKWESAGRGSLWDSQEPATCPNHEPDQSSPCTPIPLLEGLFQFYHPIYALGLQNCLFSSCFHTRTLYAPLLSPYMLHVKPISCFLNKQFKLQIFIQITEIKEDTAQDLHLPTPLDLHQMQSKTRDFTRIFNVNTKFPRARGRREGEPGRQRETLSI